MHTPGVSDSVHHHSIDILLPLQGPGEGVTFFHSLVDLVSSEPGVLIEFECSHMSVCTQWTLLDL